jgi:hypothetical protein
MNRERELKKRLKNEYRCDERRKPKVEESTCLEYGTPKDQDEVNKLEACECDG